MKFVAIDPGDIHVGWAEFEKTSVAPGWICFKVEELTPNEALERLWRCRAGTWSVFVVEGFWLQPDEAPKLVGQQMLTSQMIGAIQWIGHVKNTRVVLQRNVVKKPTNSLMHRRGIGSFAIHQGAGGHAKDAETHGWHYILKGKRDAT